MPRGKLENPSAADRIAALIQAARAFNAAGLLSSSQYVEVHADISIHYLSDKDILNALETLGEGYAIRNCNPGRDQFRIYRVEAGEGFIDFFGDNLDKNAASLWRSTPS